MHPRLCVSAVSSYGWTLDQDLTFWEDAGIDRVGLSLRKVDDAGFDRAVARVRDAGLTVVNVGEIRWFQLDRREQWPNQRDRVRRAVALAGATGAGVIVLVSGPAGPLSPEDAAAALAEALEPVMADARAASTVFALENTNPRRTDYSFVTSLGDAAVRAAALGVAVCVELNSCWQESGVEDALRAIAPTAALVQVNDAVAAAPSDMTPDRRVPGDGELPLPRLIQALVDGHYAGMFDLEFVGPAIEAEGYASAIRRSLTYLDALLDTAMRTSP